MKRLFALVLAVFLSLSLSFSALALSFDRFEYKNGDTYLGIFDVNGLTELEYSQYYSIVTSPNCFVVYSDYSPNGESGDFYYLFDIEDTSAVSILNNESKGNRADLWSFEAVNSYNDCNVSGLYFRDNGSGKLVYEGIYNHPNERTMYSLIILGGLGADDLDYSYLTVDAVANVKGQLIIEDNYNPDAIPPDDDTEEDGYGSGILGWLHSFWDTLRDFFLSLFIPSDGFFSDWYNEIKTAFDAKFSSLTELFSLLTGFFNGLDASVTDFPLFSNPYFTPLFKSG